MILEELCAVCAIWLRLRTAKSAVSPVRIWCRRIRVSVTCWSAVATCSLVTAWTKIAFTYPAIRGGML